MALFRFESRPTFRDLAGRFTKAHEQLLADFRDEMRGLGQKFVTFARNEAPKKTGKFARGIRYETFASKGGVGFRLKTPQPLGTFIVKGTKAHIIRAKEASALYFHWDKVGMYTVVPKRGGFRTHASGGKLWVGKGYVNHPGTKPNDFLDRAYRQWQPESRLALNRISTRFTTTIAGKGVK